MVAQVEVGRGNACVSVTSLGLGLETEEALLDFYRLQVLFEGYDWEALTEICWASTCATFEVPALREGPPASFLWADTTFGEPTETDGNQAGSFLAITDDGRFLCTALGEGLAGRAETLSGAFHFESTNYDLAPPRMKEIVAGQSTPANMVGHFLKAVFLCHAEQSDYSAYLGSVFDESSVCCGSGYCASDTSDLLG
eukprot:Polyplicarium_translucidae@DN3396_c2_g2_i15.p1